MRTILRNTYIGTISGLFCASLYSAFALVLYLFGGGSARFEANDTTLLNAIAAYFAGGLAGGATAGLLAPLGKRWYGAMLVGTVVAVPLLTAFFVALDGISRLGDNLWIVAMLTPIAGPGGGLFVWKQFRNGLSPSPEVQEQEKQGWR